MGFGSDGLAIVIAGFDAEVGLLAGGVAVAVGHDVDHEGAARGDGVGGAGDFAITFVGDAGFDAIDEIGFGERGGERDVEMTVRVELAGLLADLSPPPPESGSGSLSAGLGSPSAPSSSPL